MNTIRLRLADAHVIFGAAYDDEPGRRHPRHRGGHRPVARANARRQTTVVQGGLRTGTDNVAYQMPDAEPGRPGAGTGGGATQPNTATWQVPSVWRTNRTGARHASTRCPTAWTWIERKSRPSCARSS